MKRKIVPSARNSFSTYSVILAILFVLCAGFTYLAMKNINNSILVELNDKQQILSILKNTRIDFANEHNAITHGLSENPQIASQIYDEAEKNLQTSFNRLKELIKDKNDKSDLNSLSYNQAMFSEQVNRMLKTQWARRGQSLTYDELVDIKSYTVQALAEANRHAETFNRVLNQLEQRFIDDYTKKTASLMGFLMNFKNGIYIFIGLLFLLAFVFGIRVLKNSISPLQKASELLKKMVDSNYTNMPDYSQVDDIHVRNILKSFNTLASDYRNYANESAWAIRNILEINGKIITYFKDLKISENKALETGKESIRKILAYSQELENVRFYIERIQETIDSIQKKESTYLEDIKKQFNRINSLTTNEKNQENILLQLLELENKTGMLAVNISLEAAKLGEKGAGFTPISNEIRKLADLSKETIGQFIEIHKGNRNIIMEINEKIGISGKLYDEVHKKIQELYLVNGKLDEIRNNGMESEAILTQNNMKESEIRKECLNIINVTEKEINHSSSALGEILEGYETMRFDPSGSAPPEATTEDLYVSPSQPKNPSGE